MTGLVGSVASLAAALVVGTPAGAQTEIPVEEGTDTLHEAVAAASPGDTLVLAPGLYEITHTVVIDKSLTIRGETGHQEDVHIAAVSADEFDFQVLEFPDILDRGHILFVRAPAQWILLSDFTIKNAPETDISELECEEEPPFGFGLNHSECFGDAIHVDGVADVTVEDVEASLNAGNGIWVDGAKSAKFRRIVAVNNGAFGIDVDTALYLSIRDSSFVGNQVSGVEASGHPFGLHRDDYTANALIEDSVAKGNGEIGIEFERFAKLKVKDVVCADNREDGFDADRVGEVEVDDSAFINNLDDAIELFPAGDEVPPEEQPADFPGSIIEDFDELEFAGNVGEEVNRPPTEN
jgi:hypothetical protein